ncbi:MAG: hypothetical protein P0S93_05555 [Candidatus Neptunochlamydia sp.]|nr:hypothetical protein [Candidatus Neptunochlamydia sp.]
MDIQVDWRISYLPKKQDFNGMTDEDIEEIEFLLSNRARKVLSFWTPLKVFTQLTKKDAIVATSELNWQDIKTP